jgi:tol-pal system protein YbgF
MIKVLGRSLCALTFASALTVTAPALAQERGLLDNLFGGGQSRQPQRSGPDEAELSVRINQLEGQIRQLTGTIEELQHRNQQLEQQLRAQGGAVPPQAAQPVPVGRPPMQAAAPLPPPVAAAPPPPAPSGGRRGDAFDPTQNPGAPGAPRPLGGGPGPVPVQSSANPGPIGEPPPIIMAEPPVGVPGGRDPGAPLDLSTLAGSGAAAPPPQQHPASATLLPPPPSRNPSATGAGAPVAPPSNSPKDYYDLAYGYVLRKDYAFAEDAFQTFLKKYPGDRLVPDAQFWLGESLFQRQRYDAAAEQFLAISTKHGAHAKAPDALLRLGQSLAALNQKEMACATLAEVGRKYPRASNTVKQGVEREQKRARC